MGEFLGRVGKCNGTWDYENRVRVYTSCLGITNRLIGETLKTSAFTLDHVILTNYKALTVDLYQHELAHTKQYSYLGPLFLPLYGLAQIAASIDANANGYQNPHAGNFFEVWADKMAGLPPEIKIPR